MAYHTCNAGRVQFGWDVWVVDELIPYCHEQLKSFLVQYKLFVQQKLVMLALTGPEGCPNNHMSSYLQQEVDGNTDVNHVSVPISWATHTFTRSVLCSNLAQKFCILRS